MHYFNDAARCIYAHTYIGGSKPTHPTKPKTHTHTHKEIEKENCICVCDSVRTLSAQEQIRQDPIRFLIWLQLRYALYLALRASTKIERRVYSKHKRHTTPRVAG